MLMLYLTTLDKDAQIREFICQLNELETAIAALSAIAAQGDKMIEAYILEEGERTRLSIQAFDHQDLILPIQQLQSEWQAILA